MALELFDFNAKWDNNIQTRVKVEWTTASEINNDYFELEHSSDALNWQKIATIQGSGSSNEMLNYNFYDEHPYDDHTYYRLKQVDFDGSYEYSNIVVVSKTDFIDIISIFPNPSKDLINVIISSSIETNVSLFVVDISGKKVYDFKNKIKSGQNFININISNLASGEYIVNIVSESGQEKSSKNFVCN
ncbi:MAG: T9SS type A sorting domain-containing protein [Bacteroidetes bacterium]|nr:T9SS type A sorting domain-containing protein [Bacteroidota bacterium]